MGQHLHNDKLFQAAHDQLKDYEAPYDEAGWEKLNKALDKQPGGSRMRWNFSLNGVIIAVAVGTLAFAGWKFFGSNSAPEKAAVPAAQPATTVVTTTVTNVQPATTITTNAAIASANSNAMKTGPEIVSDLTTVSSTGLSEQPKKSRKSHSVTDNATVLVGTPAEHQPYSFGEGDINDVPANSGEKKDLIFPDQIDPVRGIMRSTHENPKVYDGFTPPDPYKLDYYDAPGKKVKVSPDSAPHKDKKDSAKGTALPN